MSIRPIYRLFCVSVMLRRFNTIDGGVSHNYPKMQLAQMLVIDYWRQSHYVGYEMMIDNLSIYNEERGEMLYSILSRCVLGDNNRSDFEHIDSMFKLLSEYTCMKDDVINDTETSTSSMNHRHVIPENDDNLTSVCHFFRRTIRQIMNGEYRSYDGSKTCYTSAHNASMHLTKDYQDSVYLADISSLVDKYANDLKTTLSSGILRPHKDIWTDIDSDVQHAPTISNISMSSISDHDDTGSDESDEYQWGADFDECMVGRFAICKGEWDNGDGINVIKITRINQPKVFDDSGRLWQNFDGRTRVCTVDERTVGCLRGKWNHNPTHSVMMNIASYEVLAYTETLQPNMTLPSVVVDRILSLMKHSTIFRVDVDDTDSVIP